MRKVLSISQRAVKSSSCYYCYSDKVERGSKAPGCQMALWIEFDFGVRKTTVQMLLPALVSCVIQVK